MNTGKQIKQWEENENTSQKKKNMKPRKNGKWIITGEIETKSIKRTKNDIIEIKRKTKEFLQKLKDKGFYNDDYDYSKVVYVNIDTSVIIFDENGFEHSQNPSHILRGNKLTILSVINKNVYFLQQLKDRGHYNEDYDYSKINYIDMRTKVIIIDKKYDSEHLISPDKLLCGGVRCTVQNVINKNEYLIKRSEKIHSDKYDYSNSNYIDTHTKIEIGCKKCNIIFEQSPHTHWSGIGCPVCGGSLKLTKEQFIEKSIKIHDNKFDYSKFIYINNHTKGEIKCNICNRIFEQTPNGHLVGNGCQECYDSKRGHSLRKTLENFIKDGIKIHGIRYDYSKSVYKNTQTKTIIICKKHGEFLQTPADHLSGCGCPVCKLSKGELEIMKILDKLDINYKRQHTFSDCIYKNKLPFDFHISNLNLLIEYNGFQHYKPVIKWGGGKNLKEIQKRDKIKLNYCKDNNIDLLILPYTEFDNIEQIIKNKINHEPILD
mgnify:FL=1